MLFLLLVSMLAQTPSALAPDERAILTVVVEELGDVAQTMAHDDVEEAITVARSLPPHTRIDTGEEVSWLSRELLDSLQKRNQQPLPRSSPSTRSTKALVVVSRPGVSKDGMKWEY